jgi:hypothetical protein
MEAPTNGGGTLAGTDVPLPAELAPATSARTLGAALDRMAFLSNAKRSRPLKRVDLPWLGDGVHVFVRGLSANGRDAFDVRAFTVMPDRRVITNAKGLRALLVCLCTCDADGHLLFTEDDLPTLEEMDAQTADAIYLPASQASGLTQADVEELVKNSGIVPAIGELS